MMPISILSSLCPSCKTPRIATHAECDVLGLDGETQLTVYDPQGCLACAQTGFIGRLGVYELLIADRDIRNLLGDGASEDAIDQAAFASHDRLLDNARRYVVSGDTSVAEVLRACRKGGQ